MAPAARPLKSNSKGVQLDNGDFICPCGTPMILKRFWVCEKPQSSGSCGALIWRNEEAKARRRLPVREPQTPKKIQSRITDSFLRTPGTTGKRSGSGSSTDAQNNASGTPIRRNPAASIENETAMATEVEMTPPTMGTRGGGKRGALAACTPDAPEHSPSKKQRTSRDGDVGRQLPPNPEGKITTSNAEGSVTQPNNTESHFVEDEIENMAKGTCSDGDDLGQASEDIGTVSPGKRGGNRTPLNQIDNNQV